jgi:parvulin-like peptidyl-prolyl isomerase
MKKLICTLCLFMIFCFSCGKKSDGYKLEQGTRGYELAKAVSDSLSYMDPDVNNVLLTTKYFKITVGDVIRDIHANFGDRADVIKMYQTTILQSTVQEAVVGMAEKKLLLRAAKKAGIKASSTRVDSLLQAEYRKAGSEENFKERLKSQGIDFDYAQRDLKDRLTIFEYIDKYLEDKAQVSEQEILITYEESKGNELATVRHILLNTKDKTDAEKRNLRNKLNGILRRARAGEDFAGLAKQYSDDPGAKDNGGLYENFSKGDMVKPFEDAAFSVSVDKISDIVETQYGYHIIQVVDRTQETRSLEEMRPELENQIKSMKQAQVLPDYIAELKNEAELSLRQF